MTAQFPARRRLQHHMLAADHVARAAQAGKWGEVYAALTGPDPAKRVQLQLVHEIKILNAAFCRKEYDRILPLLNWGYRFGNDPHSSHPVSYTHLTLPTTAEV